VDTKTGELSLAEFYGVIRSQIEHENELVNQRVIWQILTQAFFFGAYATLLNASKEAKNVLFESEQTLLLWLIPTAALFAGALTYMGILTSLKTVVYLRQLYDDHVASQAHHDPSSKRYPPIQGPLQVRYWAMLSPAFLPIVFTISWLLVLGRLLTAWW
jgi:hypothetical protein